MGTFLLISLFILGTIIGSFLNVVIVRYNTGISILGGRLASTTRFAKAPARRERSVGGSFCTSCNATLKYYELIPLASYIIQRGRCRVCGSKISIQYPLVEFTTGILFVFVFLQSFNYLIPGMGMISSHLIDIVLNLIIFSTLIVVAVYDMRHKIIPDTPVYIFIGLSFISL